MEIFFENSIDSIDSFAKKHADSKNYLTTWVTAVRDAKWNTPHEIQKIYPHVSILGGRIFVFNIKGNSYRLIVEIDFESEDLIIKGVYTHDEYDKLDLT